MKKILYTLAVMALVATSCAKDENVTPSSTDDPSAISILTGTSRATAIDLTGLQDSDDGFVIYALSGDSPSGWFTNIDGTNNYLYSSTAWGWKGTTPQWPTESTGYPMLFFAYYGADYTGFTPTFTAPTTLQATYVIQDEADQVDLLGAKASVNEQPADGYLTLNFEHLLSKINFGVIPGNGVTVHVQSLGANELGNQRVYDFKDQDWQNQPSNFESDYTYKATANEATALTGVDDVTPQSIVPTYTDLMLMPQQGATWVPQSGVEVSNAHIELIYRISTTSNPNSLGYTLANDHPNFNSTTHADLSGEPLFVKVGFPFGSSTMEWEMGKAYTYNIKLGTSDATNGYLLDEYYYDEDGNKTTLALPEDKDVGEPLASGDINFKVSVSDWDSSAGSTVIL